MIGSRVSLAQATPALHCPGCGAGLRGGACVGCGRRFETAAGFLDLRTTQSPEIDVAADLKLAELIRVSAASFPEAVELYFAGRPAVNPAAESRHRAHLAAEAARARAAARELGGEGPVLDIGCGMGRYVVEAARAGYAAVGVDVSLAALATAQRLLDDEGLEATLLAASAESLPFAKETFAAALSSDLLEHLPDPAAAVGEACRILRPGGRWLATTPNRFSLTPEPHVGVWGLGWLPRALAVALVRRRFGVDYATIRPFSLDRLEQLLADNFEGRWDVRPARLSGEDLAAFPAWKRSAGKAYNSVAELPLFRRVTPYWEIRARTPG